MPIGGVGQPGVNYVNNTTATEIVQVAQPDAGNAKPKTDVHAAAADQSTFRDLM